jgi:membrane associated rhomboid family serine protease
MSFNHNYNTGRQITPVVRDLLIINVLFFVGTQFSENVSNSLALHYFTSDYFKSWQFATHFFMHANLMHIAFNMLGLYSIGVMLEMVWGGKRFLAYYFMCAFGAAFVHMGMAYWEFSQYEALAKGFALAPDMDAAIRFYENTGYILNVQDPEMIQTQMYEIIRKQKDIPMVGASGAIYGLLSAVWWLFPETSFYLMFIPFPVKAKYMIPLLLASDFFLGFSRFGGDNTAHFAHIGGALIGGIVLFFWYKKSLIK